MKSSERRLARLAAGLAGALWVAAAAVDAPRAEPLRLGGSLGFGVTAARQPGAFRWDYDSAHEDTVLAVLQMGAGVEHLRGFVSFGARLDGVTTPEGPEFELREAALVASWKRTGGDSAGVRLFARQPGSLWIASAFAPPVAAFAAGGEDAIGGRADLAWRRTTATLLVADRGGLSPRLDVVDAPSPPSPATGDALVLRADALAWRRPGLRLGVTWTRWHPGAAFTSGGAPDGRDRDVVGGDVRAGLRGVWATLAYAQSSAEFPGGVPSDAPPEHGWRSTWSGRLTDVLPSSAALRAELRSPGIALGRWGSVGFAPQYRALGSAHVDRLVAPERDAGSPRRGLEGYRLEAWYDAPFWPVWLRQVYDRHQQFRDADRRVVLQTTECQLLVATGIRGRVLYVQRDERLQSAGRREHHDDLLGELVAEDIRARMRLQAGVVDVNAPHERTVLGLESAARVGTRLQALARLGVASEGGRARRGFWAEMQYWHLPEFELAIAYGPDWIGDGSDPVLDSDLTADGDDVDRIRLHFRGWF